VKVPRFRTHHPKRTAASDCPSAGRIYVVRAIATVCLAILLVPVATFRAHGSTAPASKSNVSSQVDTSGGTEPKGQASSDSTHVRDVVTVILVAGLLAWLKVFKSFHMYKGLLLYMFVDWPGWVFMLFIISVAAVPDLAVLPFVTRFLGQIYKWPEMIREPSLALVHLGFSSASVSLGPLLLPTVKVPVAAGDKPKGEKSTEMNVVFDAIRESLDNHVNSQILTWTSEYGWPVIKLTAKMLIADRMNSGHLSSQEGERAKLDVDTYKKCDDDLDDRQSKYELLRKLMNHTSFEDLNARLAYARSVL